MENGASSYRRFLEGDENGIVEIVRDYKDGLMLYLNGYVRNIHTAEDLTEDTFIRLVAKRPRYSDRYAFKTWLYAIGRNLAIDYLRRQKRRSEQPLDGMEEILADETSVEKQYLREERKILLFRLMDRLHEEYRQVLYLYYFENLRHEAIGRLLHKNRRQVENLLYRAKQALKRETEKEGFRHEDL